MKRLILVLFSTIISLAILAQNEAFVVEQKNGLADIFKVTENIRVKHEKDSVFIVYGDSVGESYARSDIKRIRFNEEKVLVDSVERAALVALYKATDGDNWTNKTNWCSEKPILEWYGVGKNFYGLSLSLWGNNLKGQLPLEFTNLNSISHLELQANKLEGYLLPEICRLKNINSLFLTINNFCGSIPGSIGCLIKLRSLNLNSNSLDGEIPKELGRLSQLTNLDLGSNKLSGEIPKELANMENLITLDLSKNMLTGTIPPELGKLKNLTHIFLYLNNLSGHIPSEFSDIPNYKINRFKNQLFIRKYPF